MLTLLNAPILTTFGSFTFELVEIEQAKQLVTANSFQSFIGHEITRKFLSEKLGVVIHYDRGNYLQQHGEQALIFRIKKRLGEGQVLKTFEEIEAIGYEFGLLTRIE